MFCQICPIHAEPASVTLLDKDPTLQSWFEPREMGWMDGKSKLVLLVGCPYDSQCERLMMHSYRSFQLV
jgi:hypothetical protein